MTIADAQLEFPSRSLAAGVRYDDRPLKHRLGLVALSTDHTIEPDFITMRPSAEIGIYVSRVLYENPTTPENLRAMQPRLTEAARIILNDEELDAIAYGCTSASATIGDATVRASLQAAKPGTPVSTPTSGALAAFKALGVRRVSVLAPYIQEVSEHLAGYFASLGLEIANLTYLGIEDDRDIARVSPASILEAARVALDPTAEALFLSCTALRAVPVLAEIEAELGVPAVSSNQALFWQSLRNCGYDAPIAGFGRLMEL